MHNRAVSNRTFLANRQRRIRVHVQRAIILDVGASTNHNGCGIASHHRVIPDTRALVDGDIADDHCTWGNEYILRDSWQDAVKWKYRHNLLLRFVSLVQYYIVSG